MTAFETNGICYLLKPINKDKIQGALNKFNLFKNSFEKEPQTLAIEMLLKQMKQSYKSTLLVNQREKIIPVRTKDIACFYMDNAVIEVTTLKGQKFFTCNTMDELERVLTPNFFTEPTANF